MDVSGKYHLILIDFWSFTVLILINLLTYSGKKIGSHYSNHRSTSLLTTSLKFCLTKDSKISKSVLECIIKDIILDE